MTKTHNAVQIKRLLIAICLIAIMFSIPYTAKADTGPKPSVNVSLTGLENQTYYVTLLSKTSSTGPYSAYDPGNGYETEYKEGDEGYEIWQKFIAYKDSDDFYFLQNFSKLIGDKTYKWGYYPPSTFKVLIYFPSSDTFAESAVYERYAFDSYYEANFSAGDLEHLKVEKINFTVEKNYDYPTEILNLLARIIITIIIEVLIALLFGYRSKKELFFIGGVNIVTQTFLNLMLNIANYNDGSLIAMTYYILLEVLIFVIEAVIYFIFMKKFNKNPKFKNWLTVVYAFCANAASFGVGLLLAYIIPGIF